MARQKPPAFLAALIVPLALAACFAPANLPPRSPATSGLTPSLLPISDVQRLAAGGSDIEQITATTQARAANLKARAARLRGPVITSGDRQTLLASAVATQG
jgi:hypothetical protein